MAVGARQRSKQLPKVVGLPGLRLHSDWYRPRPLQVPWVEVGVKRVDR